MTKVPPLSRSPSSRPVSWSAPTGSASIFISSSRTSEIPVSARVSPELMARENTASALILASRCMYIDSGWMMLSRRANQSHTAPTAPAPSAPSAPSSVSLGATTIAWARARSSPSSSP